MTTPATTPPSPKIPLAPSCSCARAMGLRDAYPQPAATTPAQAAVPPVVGVGVVVAAVSLPGLVSNLMSFSEANPTLDLSNAATTAASAGLSAAPITSNFGKFRQAMATMRAAQIKLANLRSPTGAQVLNGRKAAHAIEDGKDALKASDGMTLVNRGLAAAGGVIGARNEWDNDKGDSTGGRIGKAVVAGAWDTGTSLGIGWVGGLATAAIVGSALGPVGTVLAVGGVLVASAVISIAASNVAGRFADLTVHYASDVAHDLNPFSW